MKRSFVVVEVAFLPNDAMKDYGAWKKEELAQIENLTSSIRFLRRDNRRLEGLLARAREVAAVHNAESSTTTTITTMAFIHPTIVPPFQENATSASPSNLNSTTK